MNKNRLTLNHAIWATFFVFITHIIYEFLLYLIISSKIAHMSFENIRIGSSPVYYLIVLCVLFLSIGTRPNLDITSLGFRKTNLKKALRYGIIAGFTLGILCIPISKLIGSRFFNINLQTPIQRFLVLLFHPVVSSAIWGSITLAPIFEEAFFRGLWYSVLREKIPKIIAAILTSFVFAGIHGVRTPIFYFWFFLMGLILTLLYERTKNLYSSITAHILINFITFLFITRY